MKNNINNILIYFDLITSIKTTREMNHLSSEIDTLLVSIFETSDQSFDNALQTISVETAKTIKETFRKSGLDIRDKELIRNFLATLKDLLRKFKIIRLIIAFDPSHRTIENIHSWVSSNLGEGYILDIETNPEVLGGAIIVSNGEYKDLTVKKNLETAFSTQRKDILPN